MKLITVVACLTVLQCTDNSELALLIYLNARQSAPCGHRSTGRTRLFCAVSFGTVVKSTSRSGMSFMLSKK